MDAIRIESTLVCPGVLPGFTSTVSTHRPLAGARYQCNRARLSRNRLATARDRTKSEVLCCHRARGLAASIVRKIRYVPRQRCREVPCRR